VPFVFNWLRASWEFGCHSDVGNQESGIDPRGPSLVTSGWALRIGCSTNKGDRTRQIAVDLESQRTEWRQQTEQDASKAKTKQANVEVRCG